MVNIIKIYVLKEPDTLKVRYVGITSKTLKQRLRKHLDNIFYTKHNLHLCNWFLKYYNNNQLPIIELIEECSKENWQEREKYWITQFNDLLNSTEGGEGIFGFHHSKETVEKIRKIKTGILQSEKTKFKRSKSLKGRIITQKHRDKIGNSNKGNIYTLYKIKVIDTINSLENIFSTVQEVAIFLNTSRSCIYRKLREDKIYKKQYLIIKI
jgi:group I intron endonuclease